MQVFKYNLLLLYSVVGELPEDGHVEAEISRRHIVNWQIIVLCWLKCCVTQARILNSFILCSIFTLIPLLFSPCSLQKFF